MGRFCQYWYSAAVVLVLIFSATAGVMADPQNYISLPSPVLSGANSLEQLLDQRRSVRTFENLPVSLADIGQLLWAAQGITNREGFRTAPSAGALFPLELYLVAGNVDGLSLGIYHYQPHNHRLHKIGSADRRRALARAAFGQSWMQQAAGIIVFAAVYERTAQKYGDRATRYVHIEVGHAAQNVYLQAEALDLGTVVVGAFNDNAVKNELGLPGETAPIVLMPVGKK
jgi:SagB-type dehydrogenase family enzyme